MSLELDGKPFTMLKADVENYSGRWIFRVGQQFITPNMSGDPKMPPFDIGAVHITCQYPYFELEKNSAKDGGNTRMSRGSLRYFNFKNYSEGAKRWDYSPARIPIDYTGSLIIDNDPELAFFLDNHPYNEVVKENPEHRNYISNAQTFFATYRKEKVRAKRINELDITRELLNQIMDRQALGFDDLKAISQVVARVAADYKIQHKMHSQGKMEDEDFRAELGRLAAVYPHAMKEILASQKIDFYAWINKFTEVDLIKVKGNMWCITENGKAHIELCRIKSGTDHIATLVNWFQINDKMNRRFTELKQKQQVIEAKLAVKEN